MAKKINPEELKLDASKRLLLIWITAGLVGLAAIFLLGLLIWPWLVEHTFRLSPSITPTETVTLFVLPPTWTEAPQETTVVPPVREGTKPFPTSTRAKLIMPTIVGTPILALPSSTRAIMPSKMLTPTHVPLILHTDTPSATFPPPKPSPTSNP